MKRPTFLGELGEIDGKKKERRKKETQLFAPADEATRAVDAAIETARRHPDPARSIAAVMLCATVPLHTMH